MIKLEQPFTRKTQEREYYQKVLLQPHSLPPEIVPNQYQTTENEMKHISPVQMSELFQLALLVMHRALRAHAFSFLPAEKSRSKQQNIFFPFMISFCISNLCVYYEDVECPQKVKEVIHEPHVWKVHRTFSSTMWPTV